MSGTDVYTVPEYLVFGGSGDGVPEYACLSAASWTANSGYGRSLKGAGRRHLYGNRIGLAGARIGKLSYNKVFVGKAIQKPSIIRKGQILCSCYEDAISIYAVKLGA